MKRAEILDTAKQYVTKDRDATHGDMEDNFDSIAELWQIYFNNEWDFTSTDVAVMMTLLKIARLKSNKSNPDNWVDACGYMFEKLTEFSDLDFRKELYIGIIIWMIQYACYNNTSYLYYSQAYGLTYFTSKNKHNFYSALSRFSCFQGRVRYLEEKWRYNRC